MTLRSIDAETLRTIVGQIFDGIYPVYNSKSRSLIFEVPCSFDIETSSFYKDKIKRACMYMFEVNLDGVKFAGRTWKEFVDFLQLVSEVLNLNPKRRKLIVYVQNLAYEFQFMRRWLQWVKVFAIDERTPVYALCELGIEFRCSYILSGYSLAKLAEQCIKYPCRKMVGDLDYDLVRHPTTEIMETEWVYLDADTDVIINWIREKLENEGGFEHIQITKTSYVRVYTRENCQGLDSRSDKYKRYRDFISRLTIDQEQYIIWNRAFQGGYTHPSPFYACTWVDELCDSWDFTSSYPYHLMLPEYPMGPGEWCTVNSIKDLDELMEMYVGVFDIEFEGLEAVFPYDFYISQSHCYKLSEPMVCNGRVMSASVLGTTITTVDFDVIRKVYKWKKVRIGRVLRHIRGYLPKDFILSVLKLYGDKTQLKGIEGKEVEYMNAKENVNAEYGSLVTAINRPDIKYDNETGWETDAANMDKIFDAYNKSRNRCTYYPWGVICTELARRSLWLDGIMLFGKDYLYSDTDSCKVIHRDTHTELINGYNQRVDEKLRKMCEYHKIDFEMTRPMDIKGNKHPLGWWDHDATYKSFKTLRAKAYMVEYEDGHMSLTVSGLNKKIAMPWLQEKYKTREEIFKHFDNDLYVIPEATGKLTHTYIDDDVVDEVTDYRGKVGMYSEKSFVHLSKAEYSLSLTDQYMDFLKGYRERKGCET